jgi:hypothetical protein
MTGRILAAALGAVLVLGIGAPARGQCSADCADGGDGQVDVTELLRVLAQWSAGTSPGVECDVDDGSGTGTPDGVTNVSDLLHVLGNWGPCCVCANPGGAVCVAATNFGTICGDEGMPAVQVVGCGSGWFRVTLEECQDGFTIEDLTIRATLAVPAGDDYDLYLNSPCGAVLDGSTGGVGAGEIVNATIDDGFGSDDTTDFWIEVREFSADPDTCAQWTLVIRGNV